MDNSDLLIPENLYKASVSKEKKIQKDTLSNSTVSFKSVSLGFILQFLNDIKSRKLASNTNLYFLKDDVGDFKVGTTGKLKNKQAETAEIEIPYAKAPLKIDFKLLQEKPRDSWTTQDVVEFVILPWMLAKEKSVVDVIPKKFVGKPFMGAFVSQARSCVFADLVNAIVHHAKTKLQGKGTRPADLSKYYVWLDIFSANQPQLCRVHPDETIQKNRYNILTKGLHWAIDSFDERLVFFDDFEHPTPISRAWCVWELYGIAAKDLSFEVICTQDTSATLLDQFTGARFVAATVFSALNVKSMFCYNEEDLKMITDAVNRLPGGFSQLKQTITDKMTKWLLGFINDARLSRLAELQKESRLRKLPLDQLYTQEDGELLLYAGGFLEHCGEIFLAINYMTAAMTVFQACGKDSRAALSMVRLGISYSMVGRDDVAVGFYNFALIYYEQISTDKENEELDYSDCLHGLAGSLFGLQQLEKALELYDRVLVIRGKYYEEDHYSNASILNNKAAILAVQEKYEDCLQLCLKALNITIAALGEDHIDLAPKYGNIAGTYHILGKPDLAAEFGLKALQLYQEVYGEGREETSFAHYNLGLYLHELGQLELSEKHYQKGLEWMTKYLPTSRVTAQAHYDLGRLYKSQEKLERSKEEFLTARKIYAKIPDVTKEEVEKVEKELG